MENKDTPSPIIEEMNQKYGEPINKEDFLLKEGLPEFRVGLYNFYKLEEYRDKEVPISEYTWKKDGTHNITVWFDTRDMKRWKVVEKLEWDAEMEF